MKYLSIIALACSFGVASAQTTPAPPYYPAPSPAYNPPPTNGTPMVKNPVENNNPSVQASIPILNKPSGLEADLSGNAVAPANRVIYNNAQQNTPTKNMATEGTANVPTVVAATSVSPDTVLRTSTVATTTTSTTPVVKTTVIYNNTTGTDVSSVTDKTTVTTNNSGNTNPVRQTYISEQVVNRFKTMYGENLYDIRQVRYSGKNTIYIVRTQKAGLFTTLYLDETGEVVQQ